MDCFTTLCQNLGIPLTHDKTEGPVCKLVFSGLELDSVSQIVKIPEDKVVALKRLIRDLLRVNKATLKDIQKVIGTM